MEKNNNNSYTYGMNYISGAEKKKSSAPAVIGICAVILAAGTALAYNFIPFVKNTARLTFMKPENYFSVIQKENIDRFASAVSQEYEKSNVYSGDESFGVDVKAELELTEPYELDDNMEITDAGLDMRIVYSSDVISENFAFSMNDVEITNASAIIDIAEMGMYIKIPELSDKFINFSEYLEDSGNSENTAEDVLSPNEIYDILPADVVEQSLTKYGYILTDCIKDCGIELEKNYCGKAADVDFKYTKISADLSEEELKPVLITFFEEMKDDSDFEKIYDEYMKYSVMERLKDIRYGEMTESYSDYIQNIIDELNDIDATEDNVVSVDIYVDPEGTVRGYKFFNEEFEYMMAAAKEQEIYGIEVSYKGYEDESESYIKIQAAEQNNAFTGVCDLCINDEKFSIDFEDVEYNRSDFSTLNGTFSLDLSAVDENYPMIKLVFEGKDDSQAVSFKAEDYADFSVSYNFVKKPSVPRIPQGTLKPDDIDEAKAEEWLRDIFEKLGWDYDEYYGYNDDYLLDYEEYDYEKEFLDYLYEQGFTDEEMQEWSYEEWSEWTERFLDEYYSYDYDYDYDDYIDL